MIDDLCLLQQPFIENIEEVLDRFERTYAHLDMGAFRQI